MKIQDLAPYKCARILELLATAGHVPVAKVEETLALVERIDTAEPFMLTRYDDRVIRLTPRFIEALKELMRAEIEMMRAANPQTADCWVWGVCVVSDLAKTDGFQFEYGGEDDISEALPPLSLAQGERVMVVSQTWMDELVKLAGNSTAQKEV